MEPNLLKEYKEHIIPSLKEKLGCVNIHQVPRVEKVVINCGIGSATAERKQAVEEAIEEMAIITGQRAVRTKAKNSISNFRLRAGEVVGAKVTLRGNRMYEFLERLIKTAIPTIRDFRGVNPKAFDGRGNYTLGIADHTIFPEVELDKVKRNIGFDICIVTSATTNDAARTLLAEMGMPFRGMDKATIAAKEKAAAEAAAAGSAA
ncbi:MAG: large subunit ribosomal protein L5 [Pseudoalteromonas tetraodonis]|jgi:large subunit ribosomal protein L5